MLDKNKDDYKFAQEAVGKLLETGWVNKNAMATLIKNSPYYREKFYEALEMDKTTYLRRKNQPGTLKASEIIKLADVLEISPIALFALIEKEIRKLKENSL